MIVYRQQLADQTQRPRVNLSPLRTASCRRPDVPLPRKIPFRGAEIIGYSLGSAIVDRASGARFNSQLGYRFVVVEIEYKGPVAFNPLWFDEILLSTEAQSHSWIGLPIRSKLVPSQLAPITFAPFVWNKDDALITFQSADRYSGGHFSHRDVSKTSYGQVPRRLGHFRNQESMSRLQSQLPGLRLRVGIAWRVRDDGLTATGADSAMN